MDPNENLKEQIRIAEEIRGLWETRYDAGRSAESRDAIDKDIAFKAIRLAELVAALDEWIVRGGFLPKRWERKR